MGFLIIVYFFPLLRHWPRATRELRICLPTPDYTLSFQLLRKIVAQTLSAILLLVLFSGTLSGADPAPVRRGEWVEMSILTYNTHGLPAWIARDHPEVRLPIIGQLANQYDAVLLQEDFAYHGLLTKKATHQLIVRGNGPRPSLLGFIRYFCGSCGSGLTLLARFPRDQLIELDRQPFSEPFGEPFGKPFHMCAGWLWRAKDCWATKGFIRARLRLHNGAAFDLYNLHLDAGASHLDRQARKRQLRLLRRHITERSGQSALVIGGDFNFRYNNADDWALMQEFVADFGLRDSGVRYKDRLGRGGVDYILYRSGRGVALEVVEAGIAEEFFLNGKPLSDHPAIAVRLRIR